MKHTINEWQDMGLKKDVEYITKELGKKNSHEKPLVIELYITIITLVVDKFFDFYQAKEKTQLYILCFLLAVATGILLYTLYVYLKDYWTTRSKIKSSVFNIKPYVNTFDNNICYYAMTANNFYENYNSEKINNTNKQSDLQQNNLIFLEKQKFYYIETHYYINKCIHELSRMENVFENVFTDKALDVTKYSKIHVSRLTNILQLIHSIRFDIYKDSNILKASDIDEISKEYDRIMKKFIVRTNNNKLKFNFEWKELENN